MPLRYAFLGPEGTFTHAALRSLPESAEADCVPFATVTMAIDALRAGGADGAVVPMENSVEGAVPATLDELAGGAEPLTILRETYLPVVFDLLVRPGTALADVATVATHPHAEAQVRRYLLDTLPQATVTLVASTAAGAAAARAGEVDAAVAPPVAGEMYGLESLAPDIADHTGAVTRFVLLGRPRPPGQPTGNDRTSLVAYLRSDHSGALLEILTEFAVRGVNLTRIESRPTKTRLGHYFFTIDCEGHVADARVSDALAAVRRVCSDVRFLGSYPRGEGRQDAVPVGRADADFADARTWIDAIRAHGQA